MWVKIHFAIADSWETCQIANTASSIILKVTDNSVLCWLSHSLSYLFFPKVSCGNIIWNQFVQWLYLPWLSTQSSSAQYRDNSFRLIRFNLKKNQESEPHLPGSTRSARLLTQAREPRGLVTPRQLGRNKWAVSQTDPSLFGHARVAFPSSRKQETANSNWCRCIGVFRASKLQS